MLFDVALIAGMHRSGTSTVARLMQSLGFSLGNNLLSPQETNPRGFFEERRLVIFNRDFLRLTTLNGELASHYSTPHTIKKYTEAFPKKAIRAYIQENHLLDQPFAFKDPRLCLLFSLWQELFASEGKNVACVMPIRNPLEVALSLQRRDNATVEHGLSVWFIYMVSLLNSLDDTPTCIIQYEYLFKNIDSEVHKIASFLDISLEQYKNPINTFTQSFLSKDLYHHNFSMDDTFVACKELPMIADLYKQLCELHSADTVSKNDIKTLAKTYMPYLFYGHLPLQKPHNQ